MNTDRYRTLERAGTGQLREKASRFIGIAFHMPDEDAFKQRLQEFMKEHHGARHFCYAWVLGDTGERHRANDAGEPAGTAGKPILNRIQSMDLTYCGVIVVRYFGGTLLGKAGLVQAYGEAAQLALMDASVVERIVRESVRITCTYSQLETIRNIVHQHEGEVLDSVFSDAVILNVALPRSVVDQLLHNWSAQGILAKQVDHEK
jgi:uncharacterized YigZ family protein